MTHWPRPLTLLFAGVVALWGLVIYQLSPQWVVNSGYQYGWGVPLLVAYLIRERWKDRPDQDRADQALAGWILAVALLVYFPTRLIHEANPTWRLTSLLLGLEAVAAGISFLALAGGRAWVRHFGFPVAFFLVSIPWPSGIEAIVLQAFTRTDAVVAVEGLSLLGIPAVREGNIIHLATGLVGVQDACSGINSFQTTVMITLFLGEMHRLSRIRRVVLLVVGVATAFVLNIARTFLLVSISAKAGGDVMERWHDYAGYGILLLVFVVILGLANRLAKKNVSPIAALKTLSWPKPKLAWGIGLALSLVLAEAGTKGWYPAHETASEATVDWTLELPEQFVSKDTETMERALREFRCDAGAGYAWRDPNGVRWQVFYFRWFSSHSLFHRTKVQLSKSHRPEICLPSGGFELRSKMPQEEVSVGSVTLPVILYIFEHAGVFTYVFFSVWEEGTRAGMAANMREDSRQRLRAVAQGVRNKGQRLLEVTITGARNQTEAARAFERKLKEMIREVRPTSG